MAGILARYEKLFPLTPGTPRLDLGEGNTPLLPFPKLGKSLGIELFGKFEGVNPTGSFKDRGMVLAVSKALEEGVRAIVCASTGNTSASAAAYAARAGIPCHVLLPAGKVALGKLAQAVIHGARVIAVKGDFDRALELARHVAVERNLAIVNSVNRYRLWGQRSGAWEVCDELEAAPDAMVLPVGNAGNITAWWAGYVQYARYGKCSGAPSMFGVQAAGAAPLVSRRLCEKPETVATAIRIGRPVNGPRARWAVKMSGGAFFAVSDEEILDAQKLLASEEGVFAEPASCAGIAGLSKMAEEGRLKRGTRVVAVLTGTGLKDPGAVLDRVEPPVEIEAQRETLLEVMEL
ncbi:MAG: threonine synthase [Thermovirgaceae bacterium]